MFKRQRLVPFVLGLALSGLLAGCDSDKSADNAYQSVPTPAPADRGGSSIFGNGGIPLLDNESGEPAPAALGVGVNAFLWRASLDTVSFMPIASADPFGGVIITDWFAPPETPTERFKINIFILDRQLRADGIRAAVFRQTQTSDGRWVDAAVEKKTAGDFENAILTRARQLRVTAVGATAQN
ncbi:MAG: DUF3576 domain-containing protein [Aliidongia sp.]